MSTGTICPVCSNGDYELIHSHLHRCKKCKCVFNTGHTLQKYNEKYFLDEYREQYGKTYIQDFENIYSLSLKRLKLILRIAGNREHGVHFRLLDIGSAAGFFLKAASDCGVEEVEGIEISRYASEYCINKFGISVKNEPFENTVFSKTYSVVTAWYFIEHTPDPVSVITQIYEILAEGGVFAFSLPSVFGPLFLMNREKWIKTHPKDHSLDFHPAALKKLLLRIGFRKVIIKPAGFHPERVVKRESLFYGIFYPLYWILTGITGFSDTIDVYAVK
jgi:SAM-dependent methyltransferase